MREKEEYLVRIRPEIPGLLEKKPYFNSTEEFQNNCLRPIIKYQHDLIVSVFRKEKNLLTILERGNNSQEQTFSAIQHYIKMNKALGFLFAGLVYGLMTSNETKYYLENYKELNKRITAMISERLNNYFWATH